MRGFKEIPGFPGYYINSTGIVRNNKHNLQQRYTGSGKYYKVNLRRNKIRYTRNIHRLMAETFLPNPENKPQVNHINGDKLDNRVENLEWVTVSENMLHNARVLKNGIGGKHARAKLTESDVIIIKRLLRLSALLKQKNIAKIFGVSKAAIAFINSGRTWSHLDCK